MKQKNQMIAVCGLECSGCDILQATNEPKVLSLMYKNFISRELGG